MTRFVVQCGPGEYVAVDAPSPRAAANKVARSTRGIIVWYRAKSSWASWADAEQGRTRYMGKVDERVASLLEVPSGEPTSSVPQQGKIRPRAS